MRDLTPIIVSISEAGMDFERQKCCDEAPEPNDTDELDNVQMFTSKAA